MKMNRKTTRNFAAIAMCALTITAVAPAVPTYARARTHTSTTHKSDEEKMRDAAAQVQKAFEKQDMDKLAELCSYPLVVSYTDGTVWEPNNKSEFKSLGKDTIFTQEMQNAIAAINVAKVSEVGTAGVLMGNDCGLNLYKIGGKWQVSNIFLDTASGNVNGAANWNNVFPDTTTENINESVNMSNISEMAEQIQKTFSYKDLETLSKMCNYPVILTNQAGDYSEIKTPQQFISLGESKVFTEQLSKILDQVDVTRLQESGDGIAVMGGDPGLSLYKVDGFWKIHQIFQ